MAPWRLALICLLCLMPPGSISLAQQPSRAEEPAAPPSLMPPEPKGLAIPMGPVDLHVNGYLRPNAYWETLDFGNLGPEPRERFTAVGARTKLMLDGRLADKARFFGNYLFDFTEVDQSTDTASAESEHGQIKLLQSYVELYGTSTYWRVGAQIQYWGFINGLWKPTDRFNAKDFGYKSPDLEDTKLPDAGAEFVWNVGGQNLSLMYIPVSTVNKFSPNQQGFLGFLGYELDAPEAQSNNGKYVARLYGGLGSLDYQLSYIDGLNPRADFANSGYKVKTSDDAEAIDPERRVESAIDGRTVYHRYRSSAADLQLTTGPAKWKAGAVHNDTGDTDESEDPLRQSDWYEWLAGVELAALSSIIDLHYGQIIVPHLTFEREFHALDYERKRIYFQNNLLGQPRNRTHVVTVKYRRTFLGNRLDFIQDFEWDWDAEWEQKRFWSRSDVAWFLDDRRQVSARIRPGYFRNQEIVIQEIQALVEFDF